MNISNIQIKEWVKAKISPCTTTQLKMSYQATMWCWKIICLAVNKDLTLQS